MNSKTHDVIIAGGGLAGLSLAHQIKQSQPEADILVVERNTFPIPEKTSKVGESTVEIGSHYLNHTLNLQSHFNDRHLRKHGLRCFFGAPQSDFSQQDELGVSELFGIPAYQIDRGAIENYLHQLLISEGVDVIDGALTTGISVTENKKSITIETQDGEQLHSAPWIVDAAGRQALLKKELDLAKSNAHRGNAVWFRIDRQVKLDSWSDDIGWQQRIKQPNTRWLSTNHLMGPGYWVWVIPLDNGATSIGVVMDDQVFAENDFSSYETTMDWLRERHSRCAEAVEGAEVLDYVVINDYSLSCKQMFSDQRWGITGEAGVFADPFYSPGSDFIAFNNSFISHLVSEDMLSRNISIQSRLFQSFNQSFFDNTLSLFTGQYGGFGDRRMMSLKLVWDYAYYWGVLSLLFFKSAITDIELMRELNPILRKAQTSNQHAQALFRARAAKRLQLPAQGLFMNQFEIPLLRDLNNTLDHAEQIDTKCALTENVAKLQRLLIYVEEMLSESANTNASMDEKDLLADYRHSVLA